jgi:hypothetical protein
MSEEGSMRRVAKFLLLAVPVAAGLTLWGCNREIDDPTQANGILSIEKVEPVVIVADITPTDPNTGLPTPLTTDPVTVTLKNRPRSLTSGGSAGLNDIAVEKSERVCTFGGAFIGGGTGPAGVVIPSNSTANVATDGVTLAEKLNTGAVPGDSWLCEIRFLGHDLAGNPVSTSLATYSVNFVDK